MLQYTHIAELVVLIVICVVLSAVAVARLGYLVTTSESRENKLLIRSVLNDLWVSYLKTETSLRGHVLTESISHLEFYDFSIARIHAARARLEPLIPTLSADDQQKLKEMCELIDNRLEEMAAIICLLHEEGFAAARAKIISIDAGIKKTLSIRALKASLEDSLVPDLHLPVEREI